MMKHRLNKHGIQCGKRAVHALVPALFLCLAPLCNGVTNWVSGSAYGTNYTALATAGSIASKINADGSLVIGHAGTTNLTLSHTIGGFISITNGTPNFTVNATGSVVSNSQQFVFAAVNATNLTITGGHFIGQSGNDGSLPPLPGEDLQYTQSSAIGGVLFNSTATISGSEFVGSGDNDGLLIDRSDLVISNGTFKGGTTGAGLFARDGSTVTVQSGSFTGGVGNTAFYLEDSSATIYDGTFSGNQNGTSEIAGDGLFSMLTGATTNQVILQGGDFSSLAFYGTNGSIQNVLIGTNVTVQNEIIQSGGTVILDNQNNAPLDDFMVFDGTLQMQNAFTLASGGMFSLIGTESEGNFSDLNIKSNATFSVGVGKLTAADLLVENGGNLSFLILGGSNGMATATTATFNSNAMINVDASISGFTGGTTNAITLLNTSGGLTFSNSVDSQVSVTVNGRSRLKDKVSDGNNLVLTFTTKALKDYWSATGSLGVLADELDLINNSTMMSIIDNIDDASLSSAAVEQTYFTTMNTFQTAMNGLFAAVGQSASRGNEVREQRNLPAGVKGPPEGSDLRGWAKYYGQFYSHNSEGLNPEYDATLHGGVFGVDKNFGNLLLGFSGGAGRSSSRLKNDAEENMNAYHGALYSTYGAERFYLDGGVAYGHNRVDSKTANPFILNGTFDADLITGYLGGGYDLIDTKGGTIITPEIGAQYTTYKQGAYTETSTTAVPRSFDSFDADSLRGKLGVNLAMLNTKALETFAFKVEGRFHWLHEFNPDPGNQSFQLEGGNGTSFQISYPMLDEDMFRAGIGMTFFNTLKGNPKNILLRLDFDEFIGQDFLSHNLGAKVIYAF